MYIYNQNIKNVEITNSNSVELLAQKGMEVCDHGNM